jgi:hypothetical protein
MYRWPTPAAALAVGLLLVLACRTTEYVTDEIRDPGVDVEPAGGSGVRGGTGGRGGSGGSSGAGGSAGAGGMADAAAGTGGDSGSGGAGPEAGAPADMADTTPPPVDMGPPVERRALLVVGTNTATFASDTTIRTRLAERLVVEVKQEAMATAADAAGKALVAISSSVTIEGTMAKFRDVTAPVLLFEPNLMPHMRMTAEPATAHGTMMESRIAIVAAGHPLAASLTGNVAVYTASARVVWGVPAAAATKVATVVGDATHASIFYYAPGAQMVGGTAPGKRLAFFLHENAAQNVSADGIKLLDAAIDYLLQ